MEAQSTAAPPGAPLAPRVSGNSRGRLLVTRSRKVRVSSRDMADAEDTVLTGVVTLGWVPAGEPVTQNSEETILSLSAPDLVPLLLPGALGLESRIFTIFSKGSVSALDRAEAF